MSASRTNTAEKWIVLMDGKRLAKWPEYPSWQEAAAALGMTGISGTEYKRFRVEKVKNEPES